MNCKNLFFGCMLFLCLVFLAGCSKTDTQQYDIPGENDIALASPYPKLEEMVGISPCIFTGTAAGVRYGKHEGSYYPYTFVRFAGIKFIKKSVDVSLGKDGTLEISYMGGMLDDASVLEMSVMPDFKLGKRYLVFLRGGGWRLSPIPGINMGLFELRGRADGDPLVLDANEMPIAGFKEGYRALSTRKLLKDEITQEKQGPSKEKEEEIPIDEAKRLRIVTQKPLDSKKVDELESELKAKEKEMDKEKTDKESDQARQFEQRWSKVLKLSELLNEINSLTKKTQGKYKKFEKLYFVPVPSAKDGKLKPKPIKTKSN